jgi:hypothetical protein
MQRSRERAQAGAQGVGIAGDELLDLAMGAFPDGRCMQQDLVTFCGKAQDTAAAIVGVVFDFDEAAARERFEGGGEGGAIHGQKRCDGRHRRRLGPVQRHQKGELAIGELKGSESFVKTARQGAGCTLHVEAEAAIPHEEGGLEREFFHT